MVGGKNIRGGVRTEGFIRCCESRVKSSKLGKLLQVGLDAHALSSMVASSTSISLLLTEEGRSGTPLASFSA